MGRLILAPRAEATPDGEHLTDAGIAQAQWMGEQLLRTSINTAFSGQLAADKLTVDHVIAVQSGTVPKAGLRELNDPGQSAGDEESFLAAASQVDGFHTRFIKHRLSAAETVLVVAGANKLRAYIRLMEKAKAEDVMELDVTSPPTIRVYDTLKLQTIKAPYEVMRMPRAA